VTFSVGELRGLEYFVRVADSILPHHHPSRLQLPVLLARVQREIGISRERNETDCGDEQLDESHDDYIGTAEAAAVMGCTQRRVQQKIFRGELNAEIISSRYLLRRKDIA
jgi:hypothetical protein